MNDTINNTDSLIKRYSETVRRIHTVLSQLNTSSNQRGFNKYLYYICQEYDSSITMQYCSSVHKREAITMCPTGVFIDPRNALWGFPTLRLPDGSAALWPWRTMRPATQKIATCDLGASATCNLGDKMRPATQQLSYGGGHVIERSGASIFFSLRKSCQAW